MPAVANKIQAEDLRAALIAVGSTITVPALGYPDGTDVTKAVYEFVEAVLQAQIAQNAVGGVGEDVALVTKGQGALTSVEYPPASGTFYNVRPTVYSVSVQAVETISTVIPPLV
ncbi:hypothetical protein [Planktothrix agardhii]|jgi:hypothetical protein|uniref:Uncharacterized protein n=1 Tax=Planktothrix agardhii TaxID=1160 RepID=A0AAD1V771_PLAAG|nr:hypothetical protein [Planktothrix agardhii]MCF3608945.1 hypothetical protein [Planktothrix agardhii 1033]MBG0746641.1 hypothetical protein [Planktothrix agardhii KL2]MCF3575191.1 hypothetical protein [Planktothrix agardhii 1812]MCF3581020.1 hypothetical protein [Planktothrix agardhii 1811]MCF3625622.1 hypothetical protein [Planktothrix agardhii 1801]